MHLFDEGYNKLRDQIFANQKKLGVIPADTQLEAWPDELLKTWDKLTAEEQKLFIRQVEIFAAYAAYNDHENGTCRRNHRRDGQTRQHSDHLYQR